MLEFSFSRAAVDSLVEQMSLSYFKLVVEEKAWKLPEGCTGDDKQVAGALHDSGRSSRELSRKDREKERNCSKKG